MGKRKKNEQAEDLTVREVGNASHQVINPSSPAARELPPEGKPYGESGSAEGEEKLIESGCAEGVKNPNAEKGGKSDKKSGAGGALKSSPKRNSDGTFAKGHDYSEKYEDEFADALVEFFKCEITRVEYKKEYFQNGELKAEYPVVMVNDFPTIGMFARSIGVSVSAVKRWAGITDDGQYRHDRFAKAYELVMGWAGGMMESGALTGHLDAGMAKFVLTNDYGKKDKQVTEVDIKGIDERDLAMIKRVGERLQMPLEGD